MPPPPPPCPDLQSFPSVFLRLCGRTCAVRMALFVSYGGDAIGQIADGSACRISSAGPLEPASVEKFTRLA